MQLKKWLKRIFYTIVIVLIALIILQKMQTFRETDKAYHDYFNTVSLEITHDTLDTKPIRYLKTKLPNVNAQKLLVFVHGAPGSSADFKHYLKDSLLLAQAELISVDRLGYGYSDYGNATIDLAKQASVIAEIIQKQPEKQVILVGHSYGGPVVAKVAMDFPDLVDKLVLLAPAIDPDNEKQFWFRFVGESKLTKWVLNKPFQVSAIEKQTHVSALEKIKSSWSKLKLPIYYFHGDKDGLVPYENTHFIRQQIKGDNLHINTLKGKGHLFIWTDYELTRDSLLAILKE